MDLDREVRERHFREMIERGSSTDIRISRFEQNVRVFHFAFPRLKIHIARSVDDAPLAMLSFCWDLYS